MSFDLAGVVDVTWVPSVRRPYQRAARSKQVAPVSESLLVYFLPHGAASLDPNRRNGLSYLPYSLRSKLAHNLVLV